MTSATADVPTTNGSRYLQQLCKHWSHNLKVDYSEDHGTVDFPKDARGASWSDDARVTFDAKPETLWLRIDASSQDHLDAMKGVLESHLDRFAFREAPLTYKWHSA